MSETRILASYVVNGTLAEIPARSAARSAPLAGQLHGLRGGRRPRRGGGRRDARVPAVLGRAHGQRARSRRAARPAPRVADERHQFARLRLRRHHAEELLSPDVADRVGALRLRQRQPGARPRLHGGVHLRLRSVVPHRQLRLSDPLRPRLAHHRHRRRVRRGGGHRQADAAHRAADDLGARPRRHAGGRRARDVRVDGQGVPSRARGAERLRGRAPRAGGVHLGPAYPRGPARFPGGDHRREVQPRQRDQGAGHRVRSPGEHLQAVPVRHRHPPDDRRRHPAARAARLCPGRHHGGAAARGAAGARPL